MDKEFVEMVEYVKTLKHELSVMDQKYYEMRGTIETLQEELRLAKAGASARPTVVVEYLISATLLPSASYKDNLFRCHGQFGSAEEAQRWAEGKEFPNGYSIQPIEGVS